MGARANQTAVEDVIAENENCEDEPACDPAGPATMNLDREIAQAAAEFHGAKKSSGTPQHAAGAT